MSIIILKEYTKGTKKQAYRLLSNERLTKRLETENIALSRDRLIDQLAAFTNVALSHLIVYSLLSPLPTQ